MIKYLEKNNFNEEIKDGKLISMLIGADLVKC